MMKKLIIQRNKLRTGTKLRKGQDDDSGKENVAWIPTLGRCKEFCTIFFAVIRKVFQLARASAIRVRVFSGSQRVRNKFSWSSRVHGNTFQLKLKVIQRFPFPTRARMNILIYNSIILSSVLSCVPQGLSYRSEGSSIPFSIQWKVDGGVPHLILALTRSPPN